MYIEDNSASRFPLMDRIKSKFYKLPKVRSTVQTNNSPERDLLNDKTEKSANVPDINISPEIIQLENELPTEQYLYAQLFSRLKSLDKFETELSKAQPRATTQEDYMSFGVLVQDIDPFSFAAMTAQAPDETDLNRIDNMLTDPKKLETLVTEFPREFGHLKGPPSQKVKEIQKHPEYYKSRIIDLWRTQIREDMDLIKNEALQSGDPKRIAWGAGVPWELAKDINSETKHLRVKPLRYFLEHCLKRPTLDIDSNGIDMITRGGDTSGQLVKELIDEEPENINTKLFANACATASWYNLPPEAKEWFEKKGIVKTPARINVELKKRGGERLIPCHEVGDFLTSHGRNTIDESFVENKLWPNDKSPNGSLLMVNYMKIRVAIASNYITSLDPVSRGIIIPTDIGPQTVYWYTSKSFNESDRGTFIVLQRGVEARTAAQFQKVVGWMRGKPLNKQQ